MTGAADLAGYSVSAVSQQIRKLEAEAGVPLLRRYNRGISLTDAGAAVVAHAERINNQLRSLQHAIDGISGLRAGQVRMGTFPTAGGSLLPQAISHFRANYPLIALSVKSVRKAPLMEMLNRHEITMTLLWEYPWDPIDRSNFDVTYLMDDPLDLVVSPEHPMAERLAVSVNELADEDWVIRSDNHPIVEAIIRAANKVGFEPNIAYEANDYQEAQAMVAVGMGVALIPRLALSVQRSDVRVIRLSGVIPRRTILFARPLESVPSPAERAMGETLKLAAREMTTTHEWQRDHSSSS